MSASNDGGELEFSVRDAWTAFAVTGATRVWGGNCATYARIHQGRL